MKITVSKNFLKGYQRSLDLSGRKEWPDISNDKYNDYLALRSDWEYVGRTIKRETGNFERMHA